MVAYATVYAAYGVYGFLSPAAAFVLLGLDALVTLAAALRHGPALAALGLVGAAIFASGATAALALALTFALEKGYLTVGLALMVPGIAWIAGRRPLPMLHWAAAAVVVLVIRKTPIFRLVFNWLLYGYGVPAAAFWIGGQLLSRRRDDVPARMIDAAAILFTVLLGFLELRHLMNDGDVYRPGSGLAELALQVAVGLAIAIGLERIRARTGSIVHNLAALLIAALVAIGIVFGLGIAENPLLTGDDVGGLIINLILLGYGLNAVLMAALLLAARSTRPQTYRVAAAVLAVGLALAYLTFEVTRIYHGPVLTLGRTRLMVAGSSPAGPTTHSSTNRRFLVTDD